MAIDRSKFKKTSASQMVQADKDLNKQMGRRDKQGNGHEIDEGTNLFRIYPVHPDIAEKDPRAVFAVPFVQTFLPAMVQERDKEGKVIQEGGKPKMKLSVRPVMNSKVHGGTPKDLVEEYIQLALKNAKTMKLDESQRKEYLKPIYGSFSKDPSKNVQGINYPQVWIVYADKYPAANPAATPIFDELRLKKSVKERLNKIAAVEAANDPLGTDPFTDIEDGRAIKILKDTSTDNPQNIYTTELDNSTTNEILNGRAVKVQVTFPLTDSQLEHFLQSEPLQEKYGRKLATRKNFEAQLAGLEMVDAKWNMGIFDLPEWGEIVLECDGYYPETDEATPAATQEEVVVEDTPEDNTDEFDLMDRKELTQFCKDNKTGILVKPALTDDAIREKLREWQVAAEIPQVALPNDHNEGNDNFLKELAAVPTVEVKAPVVEEKAEAPAAEEKVLTAREKLAMMRAKNANKAA